MPPSQQQFASFAASCLPSALQLTLTDSHTAKQRAEEAFSSSQAAVSTLKRKATAYKKENKQLVSQYDAWLKTLMQQRHSGAASLPLHDTEFSS